MELLIIRSGSDYIRVLDNAFKVCGMDKASVFPMDNLANVKAHVRSLTKELFPEVRIHKLTITETPFEGM